MSSIPLSALLRQPARAGIYHLPEKLRKKLPSACATAGFACLSADLRGIRKGDDALAAIGRDLGFPDWYGANFDALHDCLSDLSWQEGAGYAILLRGAGPLFIDDPENFATLNAVFAAAVEDWREQGVALWIFYDSPDGIPSALSIPA